MTVAAHPLPSCNTGPVKSAILDFVVRVTTRGHRDFVAPQERIAVFDNDGTLWCEQPMQVQVFFAFDRLKEMVARDPSLRDKQPYKAFLEHDTAAIHALGKEGIFEFAFAIHAGMSVSEFDDIARAWFATARHPRFGHLFEHGTYRPQLELLGYLRENGFKTFIVSGGGVDFMRAFAEEAYNIPPEQVIGSSVRTDLRFSGATADILKLPQMGSFDDREEKVRNIALHIGRRPLLAFGNSDGDLAMLRYTQLGGGLALLLHHDDAEREYAYDRDFRLSPLAEALDKAADYGLAVVSMKNDWNGVFAQRNRAASTATVASVRSATVH